MRNRFSWMFDVSIEAKEVWKSQRGKLCVANLKIMIRNCSDSKIDLDNVQLDFRSDHCDGLRISNHYDTVTALFKWRRSVVVLPLCGLCFSYRTNDTHLLRSLCGSPLLTLSPDNSISYCSKHLKLDEKSQKYLTAYRFYCFS